MNDSKFAVFGIVFGICTLLAFMLPWARPLPEVEMKNTVELREKLLQGKSNFLTDYVLISSADWREMWNEPIRGASGFQIVFDPHDKGVAERVARSVSTHLLHHEGIDLRLAVFALWPLLAVLSLGGFLFPLLPKNLFVVIGGLLVALYPLARWKVNQAYMMDVELNICAGFWITLYAGFFLGICCLVCGLAGMGKK